MSLITMFCKLPVVQHCNSSRAVNIVVGSPKLQSFIVYDTSQSHIHEPKELGINMANHHKRIERANLLTWFRWNRNKVTCSQRSQPWRPSEIVVKALLFLYTMNFLIEPRSPNEITHWYISYCKVKVKLCSVKTERKYLISSLPWYLGCSVTTSPSVFTIVALWDSGSSKGCPTTGSKG